jgi:hypothetical protein
MGSIYFKSLPFLGFNRYITKEFRTLPTDYQGVGLRQWSIEKLSRDLSFLLRHWNSTSTLGQAFQLLYEAFQMEVGLDGNILTRSFKKFGHIATHSWFKILWEYSSVYNVQIRFNTPIRLDDLSLMSQFTLNGYHTGDLLILNHPRKFYQVHSLADVTFADGLTISTHASSHDAKAPAHWCRKSALSLH